MKSADCFSAWLNPSLNSFGRIDASNTLSGATWSPSTVTYTGNNRTHMVRIPDAGRFEVRHADGSANPYLLQAGMLALGLDGMNNKMLALLAVNDITTLDDFADLATFDLIDKAEGIFKDLDIEEKVVNDMIMKAREKWFKED